MLPPPTPQLFTPSPTPSTMGRTKTQRKRKQRIKEIEEDQNTSLGIIIGAVIIGIALIISSAVQG